MLTKKYIQKELALRIKGIRPNVTTNTDVLIGELKSALMMVDCLPDDEPEKKYNEALEKARYVLHTVETAGCAMHKDLLTEIFPELRESEDERIRKKLYNTVMGTPNDSTWFDGTSKEAMLSWLEKQKEQKGLDVTDFCQPIHPDIAKVLPDVINELTWGDDGQQEQKPVQRAEEKEFIRTIKSIIADFIRDKKPEDVGFYQQIYDWLDGRHIEQKPVEWSEEDDKMRNLAPEVTDEEIEEMVTKRSRSSGTTKSEMAFYRNGIKDAIKRFSLRPGWKPTEEQMEALYNVFYTCSVGAKYRDILGELYEQLKKL